LRKAWALDRFYTHYSHHFSDASGSPAPFMLHICDQRTKGVAAPKILSGIVVQSADDASTNVPQVTSRCLRTRQK
jgi:glutamine synthetase type III